jgi:hypothetical protein
MKARRAAASGGRPLSFEVTDAKLEQSSEARVYVSSLVDGLCFHTPETSSGDVYLMAREHWVSQGITAGFGGKSSEGRKPMSGSGVKQSRKDVRGPSR